MINRFKWLEVKPETRKNIVVYLNSIDGFEKINQTGVVEVAGNKVVCDGFTDQDLCSITPELLRAALGEETLEFFGVNKDDIYSMFYELVRRIELPPVILSEEKKVEEIKAEEKKEVVKETKVEEKKADIKKTNIKK